MINYHDPIIGYTSNLEDGIIPHNQKSKCFTGNVDDWKVSYTENYNTKEEAQQRELKIIPIMCSI